MPRAKKPSPQPLETFSFIDHIGRKRIAEVWRYLSDQGGRGRHNGLTFDLLFELALTDIAQQMFLNTDPKVRRGAWRLFFGPLSKHAREHVLQISRKKNIPAREALTRRVADEVRKAIKPMLYAKPSLYERNPVPPTNNLGIRGLQTSLAQFPR